MKKNLKLFISSSLVALAFSMSQIHSAQAMEGMEEITFVQSNGSRNRIKVNLDQGLSEFREKFTNKKRMKPDDIFQKEEGDIFKDDEQDLTIREVIANNTLSLKPKRSILSLNSEKAKANAPSAAFSLNIPSSENIEFHQPQTSVATTTNMDSYAFLSDQERHSLIESLRLTSAIDLAITDSFDTDSKDVTFCSSCRTGVIWQKKPDWQNPYRNLTANTSYSLSKVFHELKKSNITKITAGASFLGSSVDTEFKFKSETLSRQEETEVYLLYTCDVPKVVLSIHKDHIETSLDLESEIEKVFNKNEGINSYKELISIFSDYGFSVPTRFVLGGQLYSEDKRKVRSIEDAKSAEFSFSMDVKASFFIASVSAGVGHANAESERNSKLHVTQTIQKLVTGGDPSLANDLSQWVASLGSWKQWRVIERGGFYPIIDFLKPDLQAKCKSLIAKYYKGNLKQISLAALKEDINEPVE